MANLFSTPLSALKRLASIIAILFCILGMASLSACGSDDDDDEPDVPQTAEQKLIGTWVYTDTETEDGVTLTENMTLRFDSDNTGSVTLTVSASSRAATSYTETEQFSWTCDKDADNVGYISFIHTGGDDIIGTGRYYYSLAGNAMSLGQLTFKRR